MFNLNRYNLSTGDFESLWVEVKPRNIKSIIIGSIYRPPQGNKENFVDLHTEAMILSQNDKEVFVLGDYNMDLFTPMSKI